MCENSSKGRADLSYVGAARLLVLHELLPVGSNVELWWNAKKDGGWTRGWKTE